MGHSHLLTPRPVVSPYPGSSQGLRAQGTHPGQEETSEERRLAQGHRADARGRGDSSSPIIGFPSLSLCSLGSPTGSLGTEMVVPRMHVRKRAHQNKRAASKWQNRPSSENGEPGLPWADVGVGQGGQEGVSPLCLRWAQERNGFNGVNRSSLLEDLRSSLTALFTHSFYKWPTLHCAILEQQKPCHGSSPGELLVWKKGEKGTHLRAMTQDRCANGLRPGTWKEAALST